MSDDEQYFQKAIRAVNRTFKWGRHGNMAALDIARKAEFAKLQGEKYIMSEKEKKITFKEAALMFINGEDLTAKEKKMLEADNIDPEKIRKSIVGETILNAMRSIRRKGDFERLAKFAAFIGEDVDPIAAGLQPVGTNSGGDTIEQARKLKRMLESNTNPAPDAGVSKMEQKQKSAKNRQCAKNAQVKKSATDSKNESVDNTAAAKKPTVANNATVDAK